MEVRAALETAWKIRKSPWASFPGAWESEVEVVCKRLKFVSARDFGCCLKSRPAGAFSVGPLSASDDSSSR